MVVINKVFRWLKQNYSFIFKKRTLVILLITGILIRLFVMPFTMMTDLSHSYFVTSILIENGITPPYFLSGKVSALIHYFFLSLYKVFIPLSSWFNQAGLQDIFSMDFMGRTYAIQASFLSQPLVFLRIFLLKLPYLLFDLGVLFMLPLFFKRQEHKKFAFLFWLFNPVVLIVSFVFGTRDIICVFFIILAFYLLYKERFFLGTLLLCIAILSKFQALFVAPFIIIFILKNRGRIYSDIKRKLSFFSSFILLIILFILLFPSLKWRLSSEIVNVWPHSYFFLTKIGEARLIYLFIFVYVFVLLAYWYFSDNSFENLWKFSLLGLLSLFALCFFHPQWFLAVIPFVCFAIIDNKELFKLFSLQVIFYFAIFLCWGNHLTVNLFAPINPTFILNLPDIKEVISGFFNTEILINIFWTIFIAITIFFMYMIIKSLNLKNNRISFIKNKG